MYPHVTVTHVSPFYKRVRRVTLCDDIIGSTLNRRTANSCSVIGAYWPGTGDNLTQINLSSMRIGIIQFFLQHFLKPRQNLEAEAIMTTLVFLQLFVALCQKLLSSAC